MFRAINVYSPFSKEGRKRKKKKKGKLPVRRCLFTSREKKIGEGGKKGGRYMLLEKLRRVFAETFQQF